MRGYYLLLLLSAVGCDGRIGAIPGPSASPPPTSMPAASPTPSPSAPPPVVEGPQYSAARCEGAPRSRTFRGLDGTTLEAGRVDAAVELDRRHTRTWERVEEWVQDMNDKLGYWLASDGLFWEAAVPVRRRGGAGFWYNDAPLGAIELYSQFRLSFLMCSRLLSAPPDSMQRAAFVLSPEDGSPIADFMVAPTAASAPVRCERLMRRFWRMIPSADQVAACARFAVDETAELATSPVERWAYVCASLLTSAGATTQ